MRQSEALRQLGLGVRLRTLRENRGMTTRSVAAALGVSRSSISRTERGTRAPDREEVSALCALFGVVGDDKQELLDRVGESNETSAWLALGDGMSEQLASLLVLEREAAKITCVELALIPGLAQAPDYTRCLMASAGLQPREVERRVASRLGRQAVLSRPRPPHVRFVIDESALSRTLGSETALRLQLEHLISIGRRPNVEIRVIPLSAPAHRVLNGAFSYFELADGTGYAFVESQGFAVCLAEAVDLRLVVETCNEVDDIALGERESLVLIKKAAEGLSDERLGVAEEL
ncbi:helix-turn-helix domain-containing protein [Saccharopolyspora gregorii]|uniref:Helix-turn-helix transcriptional regulator n=1 Tax=Saccharopolyspora gregorii TaxID=33914 RepID=A0ABP6RYE5_9PSEU|nr:helix-turn-helix transcriptional regulator [Saccharopolyspora gregorii]